MKSLGKLRKLSSLLLFPCLACAVGQPHIQRIPIGAGYSEEIKDYDMWIEVGLVPLRYLHLSEAPTFGPYYILKSVTGKYCVVDKDTWYRARIGDPAICHWHIPI